MPLESPVVIAIIPSRTGIRIDSNVSWTSNRSMISQTAWSALTILVIFYPLFWGEKEHNLYLQGYFIGISNKKTGRHPWVSLNHK